jgi:hypothetical protein
MVTSLVVRLHPPIHEEGARYTELYSVESDGEIVVVGSRNPECDLARALLAKGITGKVTMLDASISKPRTVIDIERAAKVTVQGGRFLPFKESRLDRAPAAEDDVILVTIPPEANEAA